MASFEKAGNYFLLLDVPESADLDAALLREKYFEAQRRFHPDKANDPQERVRFMQLSADLNRAYQTLKQEDSRLFYLLSLKGVDVLADKPGVAVPPALLMEVMEWREQREEALSETQRQRLKESFVAKQQALHASCKAALERGDIQTAALEAIRLRYLLKILEDAAPL